MLCRKLTLEEQGVGFDQIFGTSPLNLNNHLHIILSTSELGQLKVYHTLVFGVYPPMFLYNKLFVIMNVLP
jgi:hypothetical protein